MKILVYGAGALGSLLAHSLLRAGNNVTLLARGVWKTSVDTRGLVIRHYVQNKTTTDKIKTTDELLANYVYDIIFVVVQYTQLPAILPILAANRSKTVMFVGNNPSAGETLSAFTAMCASTKNVLFGFQMSAGRRENGSVVSLHLTTKMTLGTLDGNRASYALLQKAFAKSPYKLDFIDNMDTWLKCHLAVVLPIGFACYATGGNLKKASRTMLKQTLIAIGEGFTVLESLGIQTASEPGNKWFRAGNRWGYWMLKILYKTAIGKLLASDHCMAAVSEMQSLNAAFSALKRASTAATPVWDELERYMPNE